MTVLVAVPVLNRPHRVQPLTDNVTQTSDASILFVCSPKDKAQIAQVRKTQRAHGHVGLLIVEGPYPGDYARKINRAATMMTTQDWLLTGADDLLFHPGWLNSALAMAHHSRARVIGTNDLGNPAVRRGGHSTHSLVHKTYITEHGAIDQPGIVYHEGYHHNWCDVEMVETARARREWAFATRCRIEHLHPHWGKGEHDATYEAGLAHFKDDRRLYQRRRRMWVSGRSYTRQRTL